MTNLEFINCVDSSVLKYVSLYDTFKIVPASYTKADYPYWVELKLEDCKKLCKQYFDNSKRSLDVSTTLYQFTVEEYRLRIVSSGVDWLLSMPDTEKFFVSMLFWIRCKKRIEEAKEVFEKQINVVSNTLLIRSGNLSGEFAITRDIYFCIGYSRVRFDLSKRGGLLKLFEDVALSNNKDFTYFDGIGVKAEANGYIVRFQTQIVPVEPKDFFLDLDTVMDIIRLLRSEAK